MTSKKKSPRTQKLKEAETLGEIRRILGIKKGTWDYILVGDGSATSWDRECGWASILIESGTGKRQDYFGATNRGTNILGEMLAYVHPLLELADNKSRRSDEQGFSRVHIITDCEYVKQAGNGQQSTSKHKAVWSAFESFSRCGLILKFHWVPRDILDLNKLSHELSNSARKAMKAYPHTARAIQRVSDAETLFDLNPS